VDFVELSVHFNPTRWEKNVLGPTSTVSENYKPFILEWSGGWLSSVKEKIIATDKLPSNIPNRLFQIKSS